MLHIKQNSHFYTVALAYKTSLILQAQGVSRAWVGDYNTHNYIHITAFWFVFCKTNANSSEYRHPSQRLHTSSPLAPFSEHQRTQDTLCTDEPSTSIRLFILQVLGIPSIILCYHLQTG